MNCCILRIINGMTYKTLQLVKLFCFISSSKEEVIQTLKKGGWNIIILWQTDEGTHTTWARTMYSTTYLKVFQDCSRYYVYISLMEFDFQCDLYVALNWAVCNIVSIWLSFKSRVHGVDKIFNRAQTDKHLGQNLPYIYVCNNKKIK